MAEENEVQIILTAVDNASKTIDGVSDSLSGVGGGSGGLAKSAEEVTNAYSKMTTEQLQNVDVLKLSKTEADKWSKAIDANTAKINAGLTPAVKASTISIGGYTVATTTAIAAGVLAVAVVADLAAAYIVLKSSGDFAENTLNNIADATQEDILLATEYQRVVRETTTVLDTFKAIGVSAWNEIGRESTKIVLGWEKILDRVFGSGFNFPTLGEGGFQQTQMPEEFQTGGGDFFQRYAEQAGFLSQSIEELNYVLGYSEDAFNKQAIAALFAKASLDGFVSPEESEYILGLAESLGILTEQEREAAQQAWNFQNIMLAIMDMPAEVRKKFILNVELFGSAAAIAAMQGMGQNLPQITTIPTESQFNWQQNDEVTQMMAGGGTAGIGDWAMVGDLPGGGVLPTTEYVRANRGGGFTVFNQSQMAGKSAPPMASGGMVMPQSDEVELSDRTIDKLADALAFKIAMRQ